MWKCELIPQHQSPLFTSKGVWRAGMMWYAHFLLESTMPTQQLAYYKDFMLSDEYKRDWEKWRPPVFILLPCGDYWNVDARIEGNPLGKGWEIKGQPPRITALPFVRCEGHYEGWLYDGILTDDMKNRRYPPTFNGVKIYEASS